MHPCRASSLLAIFKVQIDDSILRRDYDDRVRYVEFKIPLTDINGRPSQIARTRKTKSVSLVTTFVNRQIT